MRRSLSRISKGIAAITIAAACAGFYPAATTMAQNAPKPAAVSAPALPYGVEQVVKMYRGGIGKEVIVNYINTTSLPYQMSADDILYLQSLGLPQEVTLAMIVRGGELQQQANVQQTAAATAAAYPAIAPYSAPPAQNEPIVVPSTPAPAVAPSVTYIGSDYSYPYYYDYGYPYYWPVVGGWGWGGWGWGGRGWGGYHGGFGGGFHGGFGGGGFHGGGFGGHGGGGHR